MNQNYKNPLSSLLKDMPTGDNLYNEKPRILMTDRSGAIMKIIKRQAYILELAQPKGAQAEPLKELACSIYNYLMYRKDVGGIMQDTPTPINYLDEYYKKFTEIQKDHKDLAEAANCYKETCDMIIDECTNYHERTQKHFIKKYGIDKMRTAEWTPRREPPATIGA